MGKSPSPFEAPTSGPTSTSHLPAYQPLSEPPPAYTSEPHHIPDPAAVRLVGWHRRSDPTIPRPDQTHIEPSVNRTPSSPTTPFDGITDNADLEAGRGRGRKSPTVTVLPVQAPRSGNSGPATTTTTTTAPARRRTHSSFSTAQCRFVGATIGFGALIGCVMYIVYYVFMRRLA